MILSYQLSHIFTKKIVSADMNIKSATGAVQKLNGVLHIK